MNAIEIRDIWKSFKIYHDKHETMKEVLLSRKHSQYEKFEALKGVSLDIPQGQTIGIIGENGSGKSTLLKLATRILRPDKGEIVVNGKVSALLELGAGFEPNLTGRENIFLNGAILRLTKKEIAEKFDTIVSFSELGQFIDTPVKNYSSGMHMRLAFAVAINVDPDILLIDEIMAVGDESFQAKCYAAFNDFKRQGKTIVLVTHDLEAVRRFCNRAAWIENGVVRLEGSPSEIIEAYRLHVFGEALETASKDEEQEIVINESRWGSGEATITDVEFLNPQGAVQEVFRTNDPLTIRMKYEVAKPGKELMFGISIFSTDGACVYGTNTKVDGIIVKPASEKGTVALSYDRLPLLGGSYLLDVAVFDPASVHPYDYRCRGFGFRIRGGDREKGEVGSFHLEHSWKIA